MRSIKHIRANLGPNFGPWFPGHIPGQPGTNTGKFRANLGPWFAGPGSLVPRFGARANLGPNFGPWSWSGPGPWFAGPGAKFGPIWGPGSLISSRALVPWSWFPGLGPWSPGPGSQVWGPGSLVLVPRFGALVPGPGSQVWNQGTQGTQRKGGREMDGRSPLYLDGSPFCSNILVLAYFDNNYL